ncbi:SUKH-3 domain-containing protein [Couchioplanes caeruleus]|uniref:SUKH-3 domain-containing protein n=1 Tax=Couchioplanes caeruleus TaxID=56438 RepID=UPI0020BF61A6|nr:SUKH-3 domain-containing protein [Couchioplanes caeruleus]UQU67988.1 SUKH-3 domain-containing protein [Couchioplanes caeruleus]
MRWLTRRILAKAGWYAGRSADTSLWTAELTADGFAPLHPLAVTFLAEFGGLRIPSGGPGVTRARESVSLVPVDCTGEADRFVDWSRTTGRSIAPIGVLAGDTHSWTNLGLDEQGEMYTVMDGLATFGRMPEALDRLILGYMPADIA